MTKDWKDEELNLKNAYAKGWWDAMAACREYGIETKPSPRPPTVHDIWVAIRVLKSGGKTVSDEDIAEAIHRLIESPVPKRHLCEDNCACDLKEEK